MGFCKEFAWGAATSAYQIEDAAYEDGKGVLFYKNLIDELVNAGIEPYITLYHWELPYELYKKGGWLNEESVQWFGQYAKVAAELFTDKVTKFLQ